MDKRLAEIVEKSGVTLYGNTSEGTHSHTNGVAEQTILTIAATLRMKPLAMFLDFSNLTQNTSMRMAYAIDDRF